MTMIEWKWQGKAKRTVTLSEIAVEREVDVVEKDEAERIIAELQVALSKRPSWRNCMYCGAKLE